jgi:protein-tyrosine phosphatase
MNDDVVNILKITHIINATLHVDNIFEDKGVKYLNVKIDDTPKYKISKFFKEAFNFIDSALTMENNNAKTSDKDEGKINTEFENLEIDEKNLNKIKLDLENLKIEEPLNLNEIFGNISSWTYRNKLLQIMFKKHYGEYKNQNRILIHCSLGISRSPTLAIMYVMRKFKLKFDEALNFLKFQRYATNPICSFLYELEDFEKNGFKFEEEMCNEFESSNTENIDKDK